MRCTSLHIVAISPSSASLASTAASAPPWGALHDCSAGCPPCCGSQLSIIGLTRMPAASAAQPASVIAAQVWRPAGDTSSPCCARLGVKRSMCSAALASRATVGQSMTAAGLSPANSCTAAIAKGPAKQGTIVKESNGGLQWRALEAPARCPRPCRGGHSQMGSGAARLQVSAAESKASAAEEPSTLDSTPGCSTSPSCSSTAVSTAAAALSRSTASSSASSAPRPCRSAPGSAAGP